VLNFKQLETDGRTAHVDNRIESAYFVKVDFLNRLVMYPRFGFGEQRKDPGRAILYSSSQTGIMDYLQNVAQVAMGVLMPGMHPSVGGADSGTIYFFEINFPTSHPKQFQLRRQRERINSCGHQRTKNHVAAGAGKTIEVESFH
jgi:hypothetical protein